VWKERCQQRELSNAMFKPFKQFKSFKRFNT